jgi:hypothetical protein
MKLKVIIQNSKVVLILAFLLCGCAAVKETAKGLAGISTRELEKGRKNAIVKTFNYDYFSCYTKTLDVLQDIGAYVYAKDIKKHLIAVYVSGEDTTPVGFFFKEIDANNTQVEVSSPSSYAKESVAIKVFSSLEESLHPKEKEGKSNAKEEMQY